MVVVQKWEYCDLSYGTSAATLSFYTVEGLKRTEYSQKSVRIEVPGYFELDIDPSDKVPRGALIQDYLLDSHN